MSLSFRVKLEIIRNVLTTRNTNHHVFKIVGLGLIESKLLKQILRLKIVLGLGEFLRLEPKLSNLRHQFRYHLIAFILPFAVSCYLCKFWRQSGFVET